MKNIHVIAFAAMFLLSSCDDAPQKIEGKVVSIEIKVDTKNQIFTQFGVDVNGDGLRDCVVFVGSLSEPFVLNPDPRSVYEPLYIRASLNEKGGYVLTEIAVLTFIYGPEPNYIFPSDEKIVEY